MVLFVTAKTIPTYDLSGIKLLAQQNKLSFTYSANLGAAELGMDSSEVRGIISNLGSGDFYKSMPSTAVSGSWQDVYKPVLPGVGELYVKFGVGGNAVVEIKLVSFKKSTSV